MQTLSRISLLGLAALLTLTTQASGQYFQGFETDTAGWTGATRVPSGTNGVSSKQGSFHAEVTGSGVAGTESSSAYTNWGGYNSPFPTNGYVTSIDIYLDLAAASGNDARFDFTSAINTPAGGHRRDFAFNGGYYNDTDSTGSGPRFVFSASNNTNRANSYPKNPGRAPYAITTTGWYTFVHHFYDSGGGVLAVDLSIVDAGGNVLTTWTLSDPSDIIGTTVGGNRYGWFANNEFSFLAIDNSLRFEPIGPPTDKDQCKKGGWAAFNVPHPFKNQGDCVSFVNTGK